MVNTMRHVWLPFCMVAAVMLTACSEPDPVPTAGPEPRVAATPMATAEPEPRVAATPMATAEPEPRVAATPAATAEPVATRAPSRVPPGGPPVIPAALRSTGGSAPDYRGRESLEVIILDADVVARVTLSGTATSTVQDATYGEGRRFWMALLEFKFTVHEYLKGSGGSEISGFVYKRFWWESSAREATDVIADAHDARWDDREAIVFLFSDNQIEDGHQLGAEQYWFGQMFTITNDAGISDAYTLSSIHRKLWLPEDEPDVQGQTSRTEKTFLLDVPDGTQTRGASGQSRVSGTSYTPDPPTESEITLADLKGKITALGAEANAGGTDAYYQCIRSVYVYENGVRYRMLLPGGRPPKQTSSAIGSGQPAGTFAWEAQYGMTPSKDLAPKMGWFEGSDAEIVRFDMVDFRPGGRFGWDFTRNVVTVRPLPAGSYRLLPLMIGYAGVACLYPDNFPDIGRSIHIHDLTVTAPKGTLHEAFFDPVAIESAVGADGTNGVLKPAAFSVGNATTTLAGLKWENGAATLTLSPHAALDRYALDFIALDGSVTTTLAIADATVDSEAGTYSWTAANQPWQAGDKLMLRIRTTPSPPRFATTTYSFTVAENASAFDGVGQVSADDPDGGVVTYAIVSGNTGGKFNITHNDGLIVVRGALDYDTTSSYTLTVRATDSSGQTSTVVVNISVTDVP